MKNTEIRNFISHKFIIELLQYYKPYLLPNASHQQMGQHYQRLDDTWIKLMIWAAYTMWVITNQQVHLCAWSRMGKWLVVVMIANGNMITTIGSSLHDRNNTAIKHKHLLCPYASIPCYDVDSCWLEGMPNTAGILTNLWHLGTIFVWLQVIVVDKHYTLSPVTPGQAVIRL